ncbi:hypothetical protein PAMP_011399 [Pampus punctatissimus]
MALKQCHTRLKCVVFNYADKFYNPTYNKFGGFVSGLTAAGSWIITAPRNNFNKLPWRVRRAPGPENMKLPIRELSTSIKALQYDMTTEEPHPEGRKLFFDTHAVVRLLEENGFTVQQAEVMVHVLVRMTNSNMDIIYSDMVTKVQQEIMLQQVMSKIAAVKKDMIILEKSEFSTLQAENEKLKNQLLQLKVQLATAEQNRHLTQTNMKIDTEVAGLRTILESHKLDIIKFLAGLTAAGSWIITAPRSNFNKLSWRVRRAPGPENMKLPIRELSTSIKALQYDMTTEEPHPEGRKLFFDTHAVVRLLEENGFTVQQAEVMVHVLVRMTNSNMDIIYSDMVTKVQQEIMLQQVMSKIAAVKKDMIILEKSEFSTLQAENEKLKNQLLQLKVQLATAEQNRHLTQTNMKIDTEVAGLKTILESHKLDIIKFLAGVTRVVSTNLFADSSILPAS